MLAFKDFLKSKLIKESLLPPRLLHSAVFNGRLEAELSQKLLLQQHHPLVQAFLSTSKQFWRCALSPPAPLPLFFSFLYLESIWKIMNYHFPSWKEMIWLAEEQIPGKWGAAASSKICCHVTELQPSHTAHCLQKRIFFHFFPSKKEGCLSHSSLSTPSTSCH